MGLGGGELSWGPQRDDVVAKPHGPGRARRSPLIVTGMHRSGTSLVASLLSSLSVNMGANLLGADSHNSRGYFEDVDFLRLQQRMLSECCTPDDGGHPDWGWTEHDSLDRGGLARFVPEAQTLLAVRSSRPTPWGWKDPRTSLLLDFWDPLLDAARYVFVYRFPWDVAESMQRLGAPVFLSNPEYAYRIWEAYNRCLRDFYVAHADRCVLVSSNALVSGQFGAFTAALRAKHGLPVREATLEGRYEASLFTTRGGADPLIDLVATFWPQCTRLLAELDDLADVPGRGLWRAGPVRSRLARPDAVNEGTIDVSIVIPCYEQGTLLVDAVASVERFAPLGCELIIVNDGSQQARTLEILQGLQALGYFVRDQENRGLAAARNSGIALARARYVLPLDDDNRIRQGYIEDAVRVLDASPEVGVVYGDRNDFGLRTCAQEVPEFDLWRFLCGNYIDACAVFRKQIWEEAGGYDVSFNIAVEDWELWIQAAERNWQFHHLPYLAFDYRVRPGSMLSRAAPMKEELCRAIRRKHAELYWTAAVARIEELTERLCAQATAHEGKVQALVSEAAATREETRRLAREQSEHEGEVQALVSEAAATREEQARRLAREQSEYEGEVQALVSEAAATREEQTRRLAREQSEHEGEVRALVSEAAVMQRELTGLRERLARCEAEVERMKTSWAWRLTRWTRRGS